ncbi:MAG: hypothetical protein K5651_01105 [Bacteroidales bacterium]|nr:hypothetical protein [Bacteroidales bacterium]
MNFRRSFLLTSLSMLIGGTLSLSAQCIRQDEKPVFRVTDGVFYNLYDENAPKVITPVPRGYQVAGISHHGRHGSRYCGSDETSYRLLAEVLEKVHADGALTERGEMIYRAYAACLPALVGREGELTQLGQRQHRGIAERMYRQYKGLFTAKDVVLTAWSTRYPRCIQSMGAFCMQLTRLNARLEIEMDASSHHLIQLSGYQDYIFWRGGDWEEIEAKKEAYDRKLIRVEPFARALLKDPSYPAGDLMVLEQGLWAVYEDLPSCDCWGTPECAAYRYAIDGRACPCGPEMEPFFDDDSWRQLVLSSELFYLFAICDDSIMGSNRLGIFATEAVLKLAERDLASGKPFVRLRFGHDTDIQAHLSNIGVEGWRNWMGAAGLTAEEGWQKTLDEWSLSRIPMASNLQMIFYRRTARKADGKDAPEILFKLMLNESELRLPIPAVSGRIYDWEVFKAYMEPRIRAAKEKALPYLKQPYPMF